jgi:hypothetical protein
MRGKLYFKERQRATQWWIWAIVIGLDILVLLLIYFQVIKGQEIGNQTLSDTGVYIITFFVILLTIFPIWIFRLDTEIREEGIYVRVFPFHLKYVFYPWEKIEEAYVRKYKPLREYGGWGLRGLGANRAFNAKGDMGIQLILTNGNKRLIGTCEPDEAEDALEALGKLELKGQFAKQAKEYIRYRPDYPDILFDTIYSHCTNYNYAWDCGCANGKVAIPLADKFPIVYGTDISSRLLKYAPAHPNIIYRTGEAEKIQLNHQFDLITVAQAIHWFEFEPFYDNIRKHMHPDGIIAVFGYGLLNIDAQCNPIAEKLFYEILDDYWDPAIEHINTEYKEIPFPFDEIESPEFTYNIWWSFEEVIGFIRSWSAVQNYIDREGENPLDLIKEEFKTAWGPSKMKLIQFPIFLRMGKLPKESENSK